MMNTMTTTISAHLTYRPKFETDDDDDDVENMKALSLILLRVLAAAAAAHFRSLVWGLLVG